MKIKLSKIYNSTLHFEGELYIMCRQYFIHQPESCRVYRKINAWLKFTFDLEKAYAIQQSIFAKRNTVA